MESLGKFLEIWDHFWKIWGYFRRIPKQFQEYFTHVKENPMGFKEVLWSENIGWSMGNLHSCIMAFKNPNMSLETLFRKSFVKISHRFLLALNTLVDRSYETTQE